MWYIYKYNLMFSLSCHLFVQRTDSMKVVNDTSPLVSVLQNFSSSITVILNSDE